LSSRLAIGDLDAERYEIMRVTYDPEEDALAIHLRDGEYDGSEDVAPGVTIDLDAKGEVIQIEILGARGRGIDPDTLSFEILRRHEPAAV
jgi:uncharacterized protein YuzE